MNKWELLHEVTKENILSTLKSSNVSKMKLHFIKDELSNYDELVEREQNGIYISKEQARELLEALKDVSFKNGINILSKDYDIAYNKLRKALEW